MSTKLKRLHLCSSVFICGSLAFPMASHAEVTVKDAWVRATVPAQTVTGAFMTLTSSEEAKIVAVSSPAAKKAEIHTSMMMNGVNMMHSVDAIPMPAGKPVELKSGGYHVMLMDVVKPVKAGDIVPLTFTIEGKDGKRTPFEVKATVRPLGTR